MSAESWMIKGYLDDSYSPPNFPADREAYDHGWKNKECDKGLRPAHRDPADVRARAKMLIAANRDD